MTQSRYTERDVEKEQEEWCVQCAAFIEMKGIKGFGLCNKEESEHFGHILHLKHPACDQIVVTDQFAMDTGGKPVA